MREPEGEIVKLLRRWRNADRLAPELQKITATASDAGMSEDRLEALMNSWIEQFPHRKASWIGTEAALADLSSLLNGPSSRKQKVWNQVRRIAGWCIDHYVAVAGMTTILATLFYGFAYTIFFQELGITPEQAGLTPPWFLTRSALGGVGLTIALALVMYAVLLPLIAVREDSAARKQRGSRPKTVVNLFLALAGSGYLAAVFLALGIPLEGALALGAVPLIMFFGLSFRLRTPEDKTGLNLRPLNFDYDKYLAIFLFPALPFGLLAAATVTISSAYIYGQKAGDGYAVRAPKAFGLPLLGVRAEPALIDWRDGSAWPGFPPCALYVDGADGASFLYDHRSRRTLQLQSEVVGVELRNRAETCDAPLNRRLPTLEEIRGAAVRCHHGDWRTYLTPAYRYQWVRRGLVLENRSPHPRIFKRELPMFLDGVRCRVIAQNYFGTDVALSRPFSRLRSALRRGSPIGQRRHHVPAV